MTTLYVAGPMTGLPEFNYPAFNEAAEQLMVKGFAVFNPVTAEERNPTPGIPQDWDWYMRHALRMVLDSDGIALLPDWEKSKGATLEVVVANALGLTVRPVEEWLAVGVTP